MRVRRMSLTLASFLWLDFPRPGYSLHNPGQANTSQRPEELRKSSRRSDALASRQPGLGSAVGQSFQ